MLKFKIQPNKQGLRGASGDPILRRCFTTEYSFAGLSVGSHLVYFGGRLIFCLLLFFFKTKEKKHFFLIRGACFLKYIFKNSLSELFIVFFFSVFFKKNIKKQYSRAFCFSPCDPLNTHSRSHHHPPSNSSGE